MRAKAYAEEALRHQAFQLANAHIVKSSIEDLTGRLAGVLESSAECCEPASRVSREAAATAEAGTPCAIAGPGAKKPLVSNRRSRYTRPCWALPNGRPKRPILTLGP